MKDRTITSHFGISEKFRHVGGCLKGVVPFKGDSGAIRLPGQGLPGQGLPGQGLPGQGLPGQGAGALLRVPHGQAGLRSAIGPVRPYGKLSHFVH